MSEKKQRAKTYFKNDSSLINMIEMTIYFFQRWKEFRSGPFNMFNVNKNDHFPRDQEFVDE